MQSAKTLSVFLLVVGFAAIGRSARSLGGVTIKTTDGKLFMYEYGLNVFTLQNERGDLDCTNIYLQCTSEPIDIDVDLQEMPLMPCRYNINLLPELGKTAKAECYYKDTKGDNEWHDLNLVEIEVKESVEIVVPAGDGTAPCRSNEPYNFVVKDKELKLIEDDSLKLYYATPFNVERELLLFPAKALGKGYFELTIEFPPFYPAVFPGFMTRDGIDSIIPLALYAEVFQPTEVTQMDKKWRVMGEAITREALEDIFTEKDPKPAQGCKAIIGHCTLEQQNTGEGMVLEGQCEGLDLKTNPPMHVTCETRYGTEVLSTTFGLFDVKLSNTIFHLVSGKPFVFETDLTLDNDVGYYRVGAVNGSIAFTDLSGPLVIQKETSDISLPITFKQTLTWREVQNNIYTNTLLVTTSSDDIGTKYTIRKNVVYYQRITTSARIRHVEPESGTEYMTDILVTTRVQKYGNLDVPEPRYHCTPSWRISECATYDWKTQEGDEVVFFSKIFGGSNVFGWDGKYHILLVNPYDGTFVEYHSLEGRADTYLIRIDIVNADGLESDKPIMVGEEMFFRLATNKGHLGATDSDRIKCYLGPTIHQHKYVDNDIWSIVPTIPSEKETIECELYEPDVTEISFVSETFPVYGLVTKYSLIDLQTLFPPHSTTTVASSKFVFSLCDGIMSPDMELSKQCIKSTVVAAGDLVVDGMGGAECTVVSSEKRENAEDFLAECVKITNTWDGSVEIILGENTLSTESLVAPVVLPLMVSHPEGEVATVMIPSHNISPTAHDAICQTGTGLEKHQPDGGRKLVCGDKSEHLIWFTIPNENANAWDGKYQLKYELNGVKYTFQGTAGVISIAMRPRVLVRGSFVSEATMTINEYGYPTTKSGFWMTLVNSDGLIEWTANGIYDNPGGSPRGKYTYENVPIPDNGKPITLWFRIDDQTGFYVPMTVESKPTAEADGHFVRGVDESFQVSLVGNPPIVSNLNARCGPAQPAPAFQSEVMKWDPDTKQYTCDVTGFDSVWRGKTYIFIDGMTMLVTQEITEPEPPALSTGAIIGIAFAVAVVVAVVVLALLYFYAPTMCISKNTARTISDEQI